jgi:integrase
MTTETAKRERGRGRIFTRKGSAALWCAYYLRGKEHRQSTGETDPSKAERFLSHKLKEVGADQIGAKRFVSPQQERIKVSALLDNLEADYRLRGKYTPQFKSHLAHIRKQFGDYRAIEVTPELVDQYIESRLADGARPATINRSTQVFSQAFSLAVERRQLTYAPKLRRLSEADNARTGFFAERELRAVVENLPAYLKDFTLFGFLVGWRKGEIASLAWADVDGDCIRLRPENSKNGEGRMIVLEGELAELIERRKAARSVKTDTGTELAALIFHRDGLPIVDTRKAWATACKLASCPGRLFHDLRRTSVRNMIRAGVTEKVAMTVSGHKTHSMLSRYNIVSETDLRQAMRRTQDYLKETVQESKVATMPAPGMVQ